MMGAQARAAEYNAARNASARQASREAEEQRLPPKPTPMSLSSFSRPAAVQSRNKGPKKFTPLILEPMEDDEIAALEEGPDSSPAVMSPPTMGHVAGNADGSHSSDRIRVNLPAAGAGAGAGGPSAPSAPRAMRPTGDPFANNTPTRMGMAMGSGPRVIPPTSQYGMTPNAPMPVFHSSLNTLGHPQGGTPEAMRMYCDAISPLDMTPTKQEHKLSTMSQVYGHHPYASTMEPAFGSASAPAAASGQPPFPLHAAQIAYPYVEFPGVALPAAWDIGQPIMHNAIYPIPALQHGRSDTTPMSQAAPVPPPGRLLLRQHSSAEDYDARVTPSRAKIQPSSDDLVGSKCRDNNGEAYDRSSKMQLFVAAQQAFAKMGKTVLNSREADESQGDKSDTPADESDKEEDQVPTSATDAMLHDMFGVGTDAWFNPRPPTELDRQKMRFALRYVGSRMHESYRRLLQPRLLRSSRAALDGASALCGRGRSARFARPNLCPWLRPPQSRYYATANPEDPKQAKKEPKDEKRPGGTPAEGKENQQQPRPGAGKAEAGSETAPEADEQSGEQNGEATFSPLTADEVRQVTDIATMIKNGLPKSQIEAVDAAVEAMKKGGIPAELRQVLDDRRLNPNKRIDLSTTVTLVGLFTKLSRMSPKEMSEQYKLDTRPKPAQDNSSKDEADSGANAGSNPSGYWFKVGQIKVDGSTLALSALLSYYIYRSIFPGEMSRDITWQEFRTTFFDKGLVDKLTVVNRNKVRVDLHREAVANMYPESPAARPNFHYYFSIGSVEAFERRLDEAHQELGIPSSERIPVAYSDEMPLSAALFSFGPTILFIGALFWLSRRAASGASGNGGIFGIGKSRAKRFNHETDIKTKFADVAGMDEAKVEIMEFVSFLKDPSKYQSLGAKIPRGAILSGPPGTGKTLLAKATAGESGVPFYSVSGSEFVEMFVGVGPSRVRDLFANARKNTPCIIFIDEIDAIGKSRSKQNFGGGNDERESTLNQILTEMDGFNTSEQVVVLAGTNRPDVLDKALLRPGRFDRHITIDRPTMDGRKQIFRVHLRKIVTNVDMDYLCGRLSALTPGFSGADIANCVNEAALIAARAGAPSVEMSHFEQAIERVIGGLEKKSMVLSPEEKKTVAYHEAGHAICGWFFRWADPLLKVSIIPRGQGALGYAQYLPAGGGDVYLMNVKQLMDRMAMTLGGRVSEEIWFDTVTSGASDDFNKVTRMATAMVTEWGMSPKIGYLNYRDNEERLHKPFSEETARNIDAEVKRIVDEAYKQCMDLLLEKKVELQAVAEELLKKEVLVRDDLVRILGKRPFEEKDEFSKFFDNTQGRKSAPPTPPTEQLGPSGNDPELPAPAFKRIDQ
ncbi:hypothetical protein DV736_g155, partial [Chaetothyriales sp. CBS 134916]